MEFNSNIQIIEVKTTEDFKETLTLSGDTPVFVNLIAEWSDDCEKIKSTMGMMS